MSRTGPRRVVRRDTTTLIPDQLGSVAGKRRTHVLEIMASAIVGGMETYVQNLIRLLPADRYQVTCLCPFESTVTTALRDMGCEVYIARMEDDPPWRSVQTAVEIVRHMDIDLIHAHLPKAHALGGIAGALTGVPVVATVHGNSVTSHELGIYRTTGSHLITVCQEAHMQALAMGVTPDRVTLISNGVDLEKFQPASGEEFRATLNVPPDAQLVGYVGRVDIEKGPDQFVEAARVIHEEVPGAHFVMVGSGTQYDNISNSVRAFGMENCFHMAGIRSDTQAVFPALDLVLLTSRIEGMPLSLLEAMACGRPVVALGVGGVPEVVEQGVTGLMAGPGDWRGVAQRAIDLLEHPTTLAAMGKAARARAERYFDLRDSVRQTVKLFDQKVHAAVHAPRAL